MFAEEDAPVLKATLSVTLPPTRLPGTGLPMATWACEFGAASTGAPVDVQPVKP